MGQPAIQKNTPLFAINFIHKAIFEALALLLPLYLLDKGFGLESIGVILAVLPIMIIIVRTSLSLVADVIGNRLIFLIDGISMSLSLIIYSVAGSPFLFSIGKIFEGIGHSAYWAVIRTESYSTAPKQEEKFASYMQGVRYIANSAGRLGICALIFYLGFTYAFGFLFILGFLLILAALGIKNSKHYFGKALQVKRLWKILWKARKKYFWDTAFIMALTAPLISSTFFLYPVYLKFLGFDILYIGALLAVYAIINGATIIFSTKRNFRNSTITLGIILFVVLPFLLINYMNETNALLFLGLLAVGEGLTSNLFERMLARVTKKSSSVSTDIAVFHFPYRSFEFISLASLGFLVSFYGFYIAFLGVAVSSLFCVLLSRRFLVSEK